VFGPVSKADIENEDHHISSFIKNGGHENIVIILARGWISDYYFIDMELCDLTLHSYIEYLGGLTSPTFDIVPLMSPVFVEKTCPPVLMMQNIWTIGTHIARGLEFMHSKEQVHRDLKPHNGTTRAIRWLIF
jgi:serine/threonine protein kinase